MNFNFTKQQAEAILHNDEVGEWYDSMMKMFPQYEITTQRRVAGFLAQTAHESNSYKVLSENLNYSSTALNKIFGKYFQRAGRDAQQYHRQPEKIANVIYASRMNNGDTASGDGWKFRGGGILQLTGRYNYTQFGKSVNMTAEAATDYVRTKDGAIESACWFWKTNNINQYCDDNDILAMTKRINGGTIGLADRTKHYKHALHVLGEDWDGDELQAQFGILRKGSKGQGVKEMQEALGITADGIFGAGTEASLKEWQRENQLVADGVAGPKTLGILLD